jgi:hypothetical protein
MVVLALLLDWWLFCGDNSDQPRQFASAELEQRWQAMVSIRQAGGGFVSDTKLLFYDSHAKTSNRWRVYNTITGEITNDAGYAHAYGATGPFPADASLLAGWLTGWKGNLVLTTIKFTGTNRGDFFFEWKTNSDRLATFNAADFFGGDSGLTNLYFSGDRVVATTDGWLLSPDPRISGGRIIATGSKIGPTAFTNAYPSNMVALAAWPFEGGEYVVATNTNKSSTAIFVWSWTNHTLITSNLSVKVPHWADFVWAQPDPPGERVLWTFVRFPRVPVKLLSLLPASLADKLVPNSTQYFYTSDLRATRFHYVCSTDFYTPFIWGYDGESIWLPDSKNGLTRHDLK